MNIIASQIVIFGLTGDLARKKLIPALYQLLAEGLLPEHIQVVGVSRREVSTKEVLGFMYGDDKYDQKIVRRLESVTQMYRMDLMEETAYEGLKILLDEKEQAANICSNRLFYLSMPAQSVTPVIRLLGESKLNTGCSHGSGESRLLVEKPFGYDLASARELIANISEHFKEEQVYRIDHYVAKETSQNILTFRFENPLFESMWHRRAIERIIITASEDIGIEGRAVFYDQTGALRDLLQSHLLQLLALVTMEEPAKLESGHIHAAKLELLKNVVAPDPDEVSANSVRGQYKGYLEEVGKAQTSTETFAAMKLKINNDRWRDVPVVLESGKMLNRKTTKVTLIFKDRHTENAIDNRMTIYIQPDEGIGLGIRVKKPGFGSETELADMSFRYARSFDSRQPDAYERVLSDALRGDRTLFSTSAEVLESWRIVEPVLKAWSMDAGDLVIYEPGTRPQDIAPKLR